MENYINQIEKYLRGQMSQEEEGVFIPSLKTIAHLRSLAFIITFMMKAQKSG